MEIQSRSPARDAGGAGSGPGSTRKPEDSPNGSRRAKADASRGDGVECVPARAAAAQAVSAAPAVAARPAVSAKPAFSRALSFGQFLRRSWLETLGVLRGAPFLVILAFGMLNIVGNSTSLEEMFGTPVWPVTHLMLRIIEGAFSLTLVLILTWYSGELTWRERSAKMDGVVDALPVRTWVFWASKLAALTASLAILSVAAMLTAIGIQLYHGYSRFEPRLYFETLFVGNGAQFVLVAVLAIALQALFNQRYLGYLLMVLFFVSQSILQALGYEHRLYHYAGTPDAPYSDMNGYGHFSMAVFWFDLYWAFFAVLLGVLTHLFWARGAETGLRQRIAIARARFGPGARAFALVGLAGFVATGA
jgi:hypothetical protein